LKWIQMAIYVRCLQFPALVHIRSKFRVTIATDLHSSDHGNMEQNAIGFFNPANGTDQIYVRDPLINWVDTFSTGTDGYLYFTVNQLDFGPGFYSNAGPVSLDMLMMGTIRETGPTH